MPILDRSCLLRVAYHGVYLISEKSYLWIDKWGRGWHWLPSFPSPVSFVIINNYTTLVCQLWDRTPRLKPYIFNTYDITWGTLSPLLTQKKQGKRYVDIGQILLITIYLFFWSTFSGEFWFIVFWTKLTWEFIKVTRDVPRRFFCLNPLLSIWKFSNSHYYVTLITFTSNK